MTIQALQMLRLIKKAQHSENNRAIIDVDEKTIQTIVPMRGNHRVVTVSLSSQWGYVDTAIDALVERKLATRRATVVQLTHDGYHYWQTVLSMVVRFLLTSVAVPIVIAAATTLVTLWLQGMFTPG